MAAEDTDLAVVRHRLPTAVFASLATGSGSPEITEYLWSTERSRRLLVLSTLLTEAESGAGLLLEDLPPLEEVWNVLATAQASAPAEFDKAILHPQVGSWAAYAMRLHRGGASSDLPLWVEFGGIHSLALVVAAKAQLKWSTRIPARGGCAMLPTLGMARFPCTGPASVVEAATENGVIHLRAGERETVVTVASPSDTEHWWSLRRLTVGHDLKLTVWLDDLDPFRDLADPVPPLRLDPVTFDRWSTLLTDAWALLCRDHRAEAESMAGGVVSLVPLLPDPDWDTRSASNGEAFGSVMVSEPPDAVTLAVALVHEYQHIQLGALMHLLRFTETDDRCVYYAPWRDDPRPIGGLLQGIYAFYGIARFWCRHRMTVTGPAKDIAEFEYEYARIQTAEAAAIARAAATLTDEGRLLVDALAAQLASWSADPASIEATRLAELATDSHRSAWRLRHLRPDHEHVRRMARAWLTGDPVESAPAPAIEPHPDLFWPRRIAGLARKRALRGDASLVGETQADTQAEVGALVADAALVDGDPYAAGIAYRKALELAPRSPEDDVRAWVGIALTTERCHRDAAQALRERPDLVRAVHDELKGHGVAVDPGEVAVWLAPAVEANSP